MSDEQANVSEPKPGENISEEQHTKVRWYSNGEPLLPFGSLHQLELACGVTASPRSGQCPTRGMLVRHFA
jgi:hypothetical protein